MRRSGATTRRGTTAVTIFTTAKMKKILFIICILAFGWEATAQYKYGLTPMTYSAYMESIQSDPKKELIDLEKFVPGLVMDIRYATTNNFTGEKIYSLAKAYAR